MRNNTNVTITLENELAKEARVEAARRDVSLSAFCSEALRIRLNRTRVKDRRLAFAEISHLLGKGFDAEETPLTREEMYAGRVR